MIITIDGPAGSGKSTAARRLAARLGFYFLDTGAMYRAVAWTCLEQRIDLADAARVARAAAGATIGFDGRRVLLNGADVTEPIRIPDVTRAASIVALNPDVRQLLVARQRELAAGLDIVTEGRDQGSVVFPHAEFKFYLTASADERAVRRQQELAEQGTVVPLEQVRAEIKDRDNRDATRDVAPLKPADGAIHVDTSNMTIDEVAALLERTVREARA